MSVAARERKGAKEVSYSALYTTRTGHKLSERGDGGLVFWTDKLAESAFTEVWLSGLLGSSIGARTKRYAQVSIHLGTKYVEIAAQEGFGDLSDNNEGLPVIKLPRDPEVLCGLAIIINMLAERVQKDSQGR
jgi:hypothetical protein